MLLDWQTGDIVHSITFGTCIFLHTHLDHIAYILCHSDQEVSCLSHTKGRIAVGMTDGEIRILSDSNLTEFYQLKDEKV